ncbi:glycosyltransferase [Aliigemmobacter aestuarii]|uniref:Glycosyltransferase n=1 Tax=Aliigemmobacter aestuarii TaxID=1445661 RepID=A0A4S3MS53_9RHOB|nr:glycosyltransferase [Gemmobacter aestuarii]THD85379.1 glycosyltransferase [Gemmobacter aestuarii]
MKILIYNWVQFDNPFMQGGGVTLYLRNVIEELLRRDDVEVYFLSSGDKYGMFGRKPAIRQTKNAYDTPRLRTFTLWNSPVKAPAHDAFHAIDTWLDDPVTARLIADFARQHGPFDAFHIHNLEGISGKVLSLEKSDTGIRRLFYTIHNYMPVCPQIELLYDGRLPCTDYHDGARCVGCIAHNNRMKDLIRFHRMGGWIKGRGLAGHPLGGFLFDIYAGTRAYAKAARNLARDILGGLRNGFRNWHFRPRQDVGTRHGWEPDSSVKPPRILPLDLPEDRAEGYRRWRETNGAALRDNADGVFAVSDLARDSAMRFLPEGSRVETLTLPIDIEVSPERRAKIRAERQPSEAGVTLSFIGYDIPSKGLPFLIDALSEIDDPWYRENVNLLIVARFGEHRARQLRQLEHRFRNLRIVPAYARNQLLGLSQQIDLNVVPSIWWETFNQVTVELARLGVPSLVSSNVGAKQTLPHPETFVFRAGDAADFRARLDPLVRDAALRQSFFDAELAMPSVAGHVDELMRRYGGGV